VEQFTWKFKVDSVYHFIQKQPDGMFVNGGMNWFHWFVHICAFCTLHFALNWFCVIVLLQWVASYDGPCAFLAALHFVLLLTISTAVLLYCGE